MIYQSEELLIPLQPKRSQLFGKCFSCSNHSTDTVIFPPQQHTATSCHSSCWTVEVSAFLSTCTTSTPRLMATTGGPTSSFPQRWTPFPQRPTATRTEVGPCRWTEALSLQRLPSDTWTAAHCPRMTFFITSRPAILMPISQMSLTERI